MATKIAHIVNPFAVGEKSDLFIAQPITFETMRRAKAYALEHGVSVELFTTHFKEDLEAAPKDFNKTEVLDRSILDLKSFKVPRKLPLIKDILDRLYDATDAEYLIYTNVDISLFPSFYTTVENIIRQGYDAFVINRRTLPNTYTDISEIPLMYAEIGNSHPGHDCFIFKRDFYPKFNLGNICIGASLVGRILLINLICSASNFQDFKELHSTFHIGNDSVWKSDSFRDYTSHNLNEARRIVEGFRADNKLLDHPLISKFSHNIANVDYWVGKSKQQRSLTSRIKGFAKHLKVNNRLA